MEKIAFISGANRGIGLETAKKLGEIGVKVIIGSRDLDKGVKAADSLIAKGIKAEAIQYDALDPKPQKKYSITLMTSIRN